MEATAGWAKHEGNPVLGGNYGTCFDIAVLRDGDVIQVADSVFVYREE